MFGLIVNPVGAHNQLPTHAHLLDIGWVSFAIFGFLYVIVASIGYLLSMLMFVLIALPALRSAP